MLFLVLVSAFSCVSAYRSAYAHAEHWDQAVYSGYANADNWNDAVYSGYAPVHNWRSTVGGSKYALVQNSIDTHGSEILYIEASQFSHTTTNNGRIVRTSEKHVYSEMTSYSHEFNGLLLNHQQRVVFDGLAYQLETMRNGHVVEHKQITVITVSSTEQAWHPHGRRLVSHDSQRDNTLMGIACDARRCLQECRCGNAMNSYDCKRCLMDN